jgi:hypothetical protein
MPRLLKYAKSKKSLKGLLIATREDLTKVLTIEFLKLNKSYIFMFHVLCFNIIQIVTVSGAPQTSNVSSFVQFLY